MLSPGSAGESFDLPWRRGVDNRVKPIPVAHGFARRAKKSGTPGKIRTYDLLLRRQNVLHVLSNTCAHFVDVKWTKLTLLHA